MTEKKQFLHPGHNAKEGGERKQRFLSEPDLALSYRRWQDLQSVGSKDAMESIRHLHCDFCSPQFSEGLCIQDKQESTLVLQDEKKARMNAQAELHSTIQPTTHLSPTREPPQKSPNVQPGHTGRYNQSIQTKPVRQVARSTNSHRCHSRNTDIPRYTPTWSLPGCAWQLQRHTPWGAWC